MYIFNSVNYKKTYDNIIQNRINNPLSDSEYGERHHIIPRCLGGSNKKENIVKLTSREHFLCHALLAEMYERNSWEWHKMNHAFIMMKAQSQSHDKNRYFNSRLYELKKKDFSKVMSKEQSGKNNTQYGKVWVHNLKLKISKPIPSTEVSDYLNSNWKIGRVVDFELNDLNLKKKLINSKESEKRRKDKIEIAKRLFEDFLNSDYKSIREYCLYSNVNKSQAQLSSMWKRFIPELYNPVPRTHFKNRL